MTGNTRGWVKAAGLLLLTMLGACASSPDRPDQALARAQAAISQAEQSGARQYGPIALDDARRKLGQAQTAVTEEDMLLAERYAEEAVLAADLAAAKARTGKAQRAVEELEDSIAVLRQEIARSQRMGETG
jgi:hypothetical protein